MQTAELVLINPRLNGGDKYPPLSLLNLAAFVRDHGCTVRIIDAQAEGLGDRDVLAMVRQHNPILCGITFMTSQSAIVKETLSVLRGANLPCKYVAGGVHVSVLPGETGLTGFDYGVIGEGEITLVELVHALKESRDVNSIPGLWTADNILQPRELISNLDSLPLPAWDLVEVKNYKVSQPDTRYTQGKGDCLTISTSRGCLYKCAFCSSHAVYGYSHRTRSPARIVDEMEMLYRIYGVNEFFLVDESILGNAERAEEFAGQILSRGLRFQFASSARATDKGVNRDTMRKMREAGLVRIDFGVESGSQKILNDITKGTRISILEEAHHTAHQAGIQTTSLMMAGHLEESWEDIYASIELIARLETDFAEFGPMTPFPGTVAYEKARKSGWIRETDWQWYYISCPYRVMRSRFFDYQDIFKLSYLCSDAARLIISWKKKPPKSAWDFFMLLSKRWLVIGLKPSGRYCVAKYMLTGDNKYLRMLGLHQVDRKAMIKIFDNIDTLPYVLEIRRQPVRVLHLLKGAKGLKLLFSLCIAALGIAWETMADLVLCVVYAIRLRRDVKSGGTMSKWQSVP